MIPSYNDCARRAAAKQWPELAVSVGVIIKQLPPSIGASVGTAAHVGSIALVKNESDVIDRSVEKLREITQNGVLYDTITGKLNDAEQQVITLVGGFKKQILPGITDVTRCEQSRRAIALEFEITGSSDIETVNSIPDLKFGNKCRPYHGQLGVYSLIRSAEGDSKPERLYVIHGPRTPVKKTFSGFTIIDYDVDMCEKIAWVTMQHIKSHIDAFDKKSDPMVFPANPMSMMCTDKYCPAWGTKWCEFGGKL
jgi:hypothetical protein